MCDLQLPNEPCPAPPEIRWQVEAVLKLGAWLMLGFSLFTLASVWLSQDLSGAGQEQLNPLSLLFSTMTFQVVVLVLVHFFLREHAVSWREFMGTGSDRWRRAVWQGLLIGWGALLPALALKALTARAMTWLSLAPKEQLPVEILQKTTDWQPFVGIGLTAILLAPLVEEILFRGILYGFLKQRGFAGLGAWLSALMFAAVHFNQVTFVPLVFLALCLVWVYDHTRSLLAPILAHAFFNGVNFLVLLLQLIFPASPVAS